MRPVGAGGERDVDAVVDQQRDVERRELGLDCPRARDHARAVAILVSQLHQRRAALRDQPRENCEIAPPGVFGIDEGIEAKVNAHHGLDDIMKLPPYARRAAGPCLAQPYLLDCRLRPRAARRHEWSPSSSRSSANSPTPTTSRTTFP